MVKPPKYAIRNANKAVECINQGSKAMTEVGLSRMYQLAKGENLTMKDLIEINKFRRHKKNAEYKGNICKDRGAIAWIGWGFGYRRGKPDERFGNWARRKSRLDK